MRKNALEIRFPGEDAVSVQYPEGAIILLEGRVRGMTIACTSGVAWITQLGDARDYILGTAGQFAVYREGQILVQILRDARITFGLHDRLPGEIRLSRSSHPWNRASASLPRWGACLSPPWRRCGSRIRTRLPGVR